MKRQDMLTDEQVEDEIGRLTQSEAVRLARQEQRIKYKHRQYLYTLRRLEKRGLELMGQGIDEDNMEALLFGGSIEEDLNE